MLSMIYDQFNELTDDRIIASLIGMPRAKFLELAKGFAEAELVVHQKRLRQGEIKQLPSGGPKGNLDTFEKKLFFILFYLKTYPTFDVLGFHFGFSGGHAHTHVERLLPVLQHRLADLNVLPERTVNTPEEFMQLIDKYNNIVIDGVECACVRPQDKAEQKAHYSGKKKDIRSNPWSSLNLTEESCSSAVL
jgi:hypothetical protein